MAALPELLPILVLIHDAWHTPTHYSTLIDTLSTFGYLTACPQLEDSGFHEHCEMLYQLIFDLCCDGNDVVVVGHGYGAFIASEILADLWKEERGRFGKSGGVVGMVSLAGVLPGQGESLIDVLGEGSGEWPDHIRVTEKGLTLLEPSHYLYNDLGPMSTDHWSSHLVDFTASPAEIVCSAVPAWTTIPTTYILCGEDNFISLEVQRSLIEKTGAFCEEIEDAGHDAFIGHVEDVVEAIGRAVGRCYGGDEEEG